MKSHLICSFIPVWRDLLHNQLHHLLCVVSSLADKTLETSIMFEQHVATFSQRLVTKIWHELNLTTAISKRCFLYTKSVDKGWASILFYFFSKYITLGLVLFLLRCLVSNKNHFCTLFRQKSGHARQVNDFFSRSMSVLYHYEDVKTWWRSLSIGIGVSLSDRSTCPNSSRLIWEKYLASVMGIPVESEEGKQLEGFIFRNELMQRWKTFNNTTLQSHNVL